MKNKRMQTLPLSRQVVRLFRVAIKDCEGSDWIFPADQKRAAISKVTQYPHIRRDSATTAMARLRERVDVKDARNHDIRKVITTWLAERRTDQDVLQAIMHHVPRSVTNTHYNFAKLESPVRKAMQDWADHVWEISGQTMTNEDGAVCKTVVTE